MSENKPKMLLAFCECTTADGNLATETRNPDVKEGTQYATNILRLSRAVKTRNSDGRLQIVYYQSGVGSESSFDGEFVPVAPILQATGTSVASKIRDVYAFIAQNYEDGDEICIFGYSRGAYTARKVSGLIDKIGLLSRENLGYFFDIWRDLVDGKEPNIPADTRKVRVRCVGVFDTVAALQGKEDALSIHDSHLPPSIDCALHAMSFHENRQKLYPTLWTLPDAGPSVASDGNAQVLKQIWFAGDHLDVGGQYKEQELTDLSLFWMAGEIRHFITLDLEFLRLSGEEHPAPWGTAQPHNGFSQLKPLLKLAMGHQTRLESGFITPDVVFHPSFANSPVELDNPEYMITVNTLRTTFGDSWEPTYSFLNDFEKECKERWGEPAAGSAPGKPAEQVPKFESPSEMF